MPSGMLGMGEDLPLGVYRDWRRWCSFPHYFFDDPGRVRTPIVATNSLDDRWAPPRSRDAFLEKGYRNAPVERIDIDPRTLGDVGTSATSAEARGRSGMGRWTGSGEGLARAERTPAWGRLRVGHDRARKLPLRAGAPQRGCGPVRGCGPPRWLRRCIVLVALARPGAGACRAPALGAAPAPPRASTTCEPTSDMSGETCCWPCPARAARLSACTASIPRGLR
jgi:hypothetical protein